MPSKRVVVNLSEKYGDIRIPRSLLPGANTMNYSERVILFMASPTLSYSSSIWNEHNIEELNEKNNNNNNNNYGNSSWKPVRPLGEEVTTRASMSNIAELVRSPIMRGKISPSV